MTVQNLRDRNTLSHGKRYDAKNMMYTFHLLDMAAEILKDGQINVRRPNREELLRIRGGEYEYDDLIQRAVHSPVLSLDREFLEWRATTQNPNLYLRASKAQTIWKSCN